MTRPANTATAPASRTLHTVYCIDGKPIAALFDRGLFISGFSLRGGANPRPGQMMAKKRLGDADKDRLARDIEADLKRRFGDRLTASRQHH